eukprot:976313-Rhodomonas_salina.1
MGQAPMDSESGGLAASGAAKKDQLEQSSCESIIGRAEVDVVLDAKRAVQQLRKQDAGGGEGAEDNDEVVEVDEEEVERA